MTSPPGSITKMYLGIDPGIENFGMALLTPEDDKFRVILTSTKKIPTSPGEAMAKALSTIPVDLLRVSPDVPSLCKLEGITIERYVPYDGRYSAVTEDITQLIGMLRVVFLNSYPDTPIHLLRAIDWKVPLAQILSKYQGFQNPGDGLDKKFSFAAARHLVVNPEVLASSHEADSVCLAALFSLVERYRNVPKESTK